jgi:AcrR family transcriptional regulator
MGSKFENLNPKDRLVKTALHLFYTKGYDATSVNQIIEESTTHKASFYRYFHDKEELGEAYLQIQGESFNDGWKTLMKKSPTPADFINRWISLLKRQVRSNAYFGCPIAKFMSSSAIPETSKEKAIEIFNLWIQTLANYFEEKKSEGILGETFDSMNKARRFLKLFQGNSQFYVITGNAKYFDEMEQEMLDELS